VAQETLARIEALDWTVSVGETLSDIDNPADLPPLPCGERGPAPSPLRGEGRGEGQSRR
jgi:hypothetical protein